MMYIAWLSYYSANGDCTGNVDMIVCGAGTGGTVCGIGKKVKEVAPNCKVRMYFVDTAYSVLYYSGTDW